MFNSVFRYKSLDNIKEFREDNLKLERFFNNAYKNSKNVKIYFDEYKSKIEKVLL